MKAILESNGVILGVGGTTDKAVVEASKCQGQEGLIGRTDELGSHLDAKAGDRHSLYIHECSPELAKRVMTYDGKENKNGGKDMKELYAYMACHFIDGVFEPVAEFSGAELGYFVIDWPGCELDGKRVAIVFYGESDYFTPYDWQGPQIDMGDLDKIAESQWVFIDGSEAIMRDGLPCILR